jgi:hypothetical protein
VAYLYLEPLGQSVNDRRADAVQSAGYLISAAAEFAARVQYRKYDRDGRYAELRLDTDGDAAAVVGHADYVSGQYLDDYIFAVFRERFVDGVIDYFIYQMMKAARAGGAYIHSGAFSYRFQALEDLYLVGSVIVILICPVFFAHLILRSPPQFIIILRYAFRRRRHRAGKHGRRPRGRIICLAPL